MRPTSDEPWRDRALWLENRVDRIGTDRDHWKARAEAAEAVVQAARAWRAARRYSMTGDTWIAAVATHNALVAAVDALPAEETVVGLDHIG